MRREHYQYFYRLTSEDSSALQDILSSTHVTFNECVEFKKFLASTTSFTLDADSVYVPLTQAEKDRVSASLPVTQDNFVKLNRQFIRIEKGDTLSLLAQEFNKKSYAELLSYNQNNVFVKSADLIFWGGYLYLDELDLQEQQTQVTVSEAEIPRQINELRLHGLLQDVPTQQQPSALSNQPAKLNHPNVSSNFFSASSFYPSFSLTTSAFASSSVPMTDFIDEELVPLTPDKTSLQGNDKRGTEEFNFTSPAFIFGHGMASIDISKTYQEEMKKNFLRLRLPLSPLLSAGLAIDLDKKNIRSADILLGNRATARGLVFFKQGESFHHEIYERYGSLDHGMRIHHERPLVSVRLYPPGRVLTGFGDDVLEIMFEKSHFQTAQLMTKNGYLTGAVDYLLKTDPQLVQLFSGDEVKTRGALRDVLVKTHTAFSSQFLGEMVSYHFISYGLENYGGLESEENLNQSLSLAGSVASVKVYREGFHSLAHGYSLQMGRAQISAMTRSALSLVAAHYVVGEGLDYYADISGKETDFVGRTPLHLAGDGAIYLGAKGLASIINSTNFTSVFDDAAKALSTTTARAATQAASAVSPQTTTARFLSSALRPLAGAGTVVNGIGTAGMAVAIADGFTNMVAPSVIATVTAGGAEGDYQRQQARTELAWHIIQQEQTDPNLVQELFPNVDTLIKLTLENLFNYGVNLFDDEDENPIASSIDHENLSNYGMVLLNKKAAKQIAQDIQKERVNAHAKVIQAVVEHLEQSFYAGTADVEGYWHAQEQKETRALTRLVATAYPEASPLLALYLQAFHDNGKIKDTNVITEMQKIITGATADHQQTPVLEDTQSFYESEEFTSDTSEQHPQSFETNELEDRESFYESEEFTSDTSEQHPQSFEKYDGEEDDFCAV